MSRAAILFCVGLLIFLIAALFIFVFEGVLPDSAFCLLLFLSCCLMFPKSLQDVKSEECSYWRVRFFIMNIVVIIISFVGFLRCLVQGA